MAGGYLIAGALLPDVAASLRGLYGARLPGQPRPHPRLVGRRPRHGAPRRARSPARAASSAPPACRRSRRRSPRPGTPPAAAPAAASSPSPAPSPSPRSPRSPSAATSPPASSCSPASSLAAALALPTALALLVAAAGRAARGPLAGWFWADARQALGPLSLALMALLLALAANVGVGTMVESFRRTFLGYLDQRLASELYVTARDDAEAAAIADWLAARPEVAAVLPTATARTRVADWPVDVVGFRDHATYRDNWPLARRLARRLGPGRRR